MFPSASSSSFEFNRNLQEFNEESTHTIAATSSSAISDNNNHFSSMMITHGELDEKSNFDERDEEFHYRSQMSMSTVRNSHYPANYFNEQSYQYAYSFTQHQQMSMPNMKHRETTSSSLNLIPQNLSEDEVCQICGDLSSGWHCGSVQLRFPLIFY
ncbi:unnamed protein product [Adineta ricciae]|uniref:Uncharacterized protein n=1 Tax=Adineta ricciae TaxID=249248 RepID=A0A816CUV8_ADIRI|nr:unnamed protein product [Adineta ricciae]